jgi:hypothetical protein
MASGPALAGRCDHRTYPMAAAPDAIRYLETEHARARVVITV